MDTFMGIWNHIINLGRTLERTWDMHTIICKWTTLVKPKQISERHMYTGICL